MPKPSGEALCAAAELLICWAVGEGTLARGGAAKEPRSATDIVPIGGWRTGDDAAAAPYKALEHAA